VLRAIGLAGMVAATGFTTVRALTLQELLDEPRLTPKRFANHFSAFDFEAHDEVQTPDAFLGSQRGDCDDYAILADYVLQRRGFGTRLIHIRLEGRVAHAICYVTQNRGYLDYNNRIFYVNIERCGATLREIADHVADYVRGNWTSVSEFTYTYQEDRKRFVTTVVKTDPPGTDPDRKPPGARRT
jgi:hypothetical protein